MSCLFIQSTFSLEIIYSIITTYQIWLTGTSISTNGNFALCGQRVFRFLMCCWRSLLSPEGLLAVYGSDGVDRGFVMFVHGRNSSYTVVSPVMVMFTLFSHETVMKFKQITLSGSQVRFLHVQTWAWFVCFETYWNLFKYTQRNISKCIFWTSAW
jgi:hypothetical protein